MASKKALARSAVPGGIHNALEVARPFFRLHFGICARGRVPPADLAFALETFARRGHLPRHEEETFDRQSWLAVLLGLGLVPKAPGPAVAEVNVASTEEVLAQLHAAIAALPASLPPYPHYLARVAGA